MNHHHCTEQPHASCSLAPFPFFFFFPKEFCWNMKYEICPYESVQLPARITNSSNYPPKQTDKQTQPKPKTTPLPNPHVTAHKIFIFTSKKNIYISLHLSERGERENKRELVFFLRSPLTVSSSFQFFVKLCNKVKKIYLFFF